MPDVDLNFLAEQLARVLVELREMRGQTVQIPEMHADISSLRRDVSELQIAIAATRADVGVIKADVEDIKETARLIEGRLVRLEKHAGLLKA